jgi:D-tagatose-1,6-bisphosphate aldolase subunit GatZ/KbaZ
VFEHENQTEITTVEHARATIELTLQAFRLLGLEEAWDRVIALVVQPGVEFGDDFILDYQPEAAADLRDFIETVPGMVYEAHSTDYQTRSALQNMRRDHFAIQKVGPGLTFAFREAVFRLVMIENELFKQDSRSNLIDILDEQMVLHPEYWQKYYHGDEDARRFARKFSLSDRSRYYWGRPAIQAALARLLENLSSQDIPITLISQFDPEFYDLLRSGSVRNNPESIIDQSIASMLANYDPQ